MKDLVTLVIILHNRHSNLDRLLEFYDNFDSPVIVADSSSEKHVFTKAMKANITYLYMPGITYTQKIEMVLNKIPTQYVALCADDDFIIEQGIYCCVDFLNGHAEYVSAQGIILKYYKNTIGTNLRFDMLYQGDYSLASENPARRLTDLFAPYKSLLYAVHRLPVLKAAFSDAGTTIKNLYLNEYIASIVPVLAGKHKDLNVLYQVREHADISDDKMADNLDTILANPGYKDEFTSFINHILDKAAGFTSMSRVQLKEVLIDTLNSYADQIKSFREIKIPFVKRAGRVIEKIPIVGKSLIVNRRYSQSKLSIKKHLPASDYRELEKVAFVLNKHRA